MLRSITLRLDIDMRNGNKSIWKAYVPEAAWSVWAEFLQSSSEQQSLTFPALEDLCLDFSAWNLKNSNEDKLRVCAGTHGRFSP